MLSSPTRSNWSRVSPLEVLITRACEPSLHEPNYALHLEVAEYINTKKANNPREAAMLIARLANHRNPHVALLALAMLDTLVQSCGYPFHLQISTKEFLNELRVLDTMHGWKEGICAESRWKEDLGNIRDMHRLLQYKGYRFRDTVARQSSLVSSANLKSAEELEEEDRVAQQAKLQELIRRGTPRDLAAAQELMKALAGADPSAKPDYRSQALNELNKLEQKVILLNELLDNFDMARGEQFAQGDAYDQVATILIGARPKIQKWISDAKTDDPESLDTFLQINDQINTVLSRYDAFKKGDYSAARNPVPPELSQSSFQATSLIDFDDGPGTTNAAPSIGGGINDLADFFSAPAPQAQQPSFVLAGNPGLARRTLQPVLSTVTHAPTPVSYSGSSGPLSSVVQNASSPPTQIATPPASIMLPPTPQQQQQQITASAPNYLKSPATGLTQSGAMGVMAPQRPTQLHQPSSNPTNQSQGKDPFADLARLF
ncbi:hypothetical protein AX14_014309 [Amanita brunnescens Koide BX004]|nr:hypothetical protein AX14_014309 [Amanita brunnescens Koide BX004]